MKRAPWPEILRLVAQSRQAIEETRVLLAQSRRLASPLTGGPGAPRGGPRPRAPH